MIERLVRITKIGFRIGTVMSRKIRTGPAPSSAAASTSSFGTWVSPAKTVIATNGIAPQTTIAPMIAKPVSRILEPVVVDVVADAELGEQVVHDPELEVEHPDPDVHGDDDRHRPDEHEPGR